MSQESRRMAAMEVECSNCGARPGEKCSQPNSRNGRSKVRWVHLAREMEGAKSDRGD